MTDKLDNIEPKECMTFDEAWEYLDKLGIPVMHLTEEQYNKMMDDIGEANSMREVDEILDKVK